MPWKPPATNRTTISLRRPSGVVDPVPKASQGSRQTWSQAQAQPGDLGPSGKEEVLPLVHPCTQETKMKGN